MIKRYFGKLLNKNKYKLNKFKFIVHELKNKLYFDNSRKEINGGFESVVKNLNSNLNFEVCPQNMSLIFYQMGLNDIHNEQVIERLCLNIPKFLNNLDLVESFGILYGILKLNTKPHFINFLIEEFEKNLAKSKYNDLKKMFYFQLIDALDKNKSLDINKKREFINKTLFPILNDNFKNIFKKNHQTSILNNYFSLINLNLTDSKLFESIMDFFVKNEIKNKINCIKLYESWVKLNENKLLKNNEILVKYSNIVKDKPDIKWIYNYKDFHFYSYYEMLEKKDYYEYTNQINNFSLGPEFNNIEQKYNEYMDKKKKKEESELNEHEKVSDQNLIDKINSGEINVFEKEEDVEDEDDYKLFIHGYSQKEAEDFISDTDEEGEF